MATLGDRASSGDLMDAVHSAAQRQRIIDARQGRLTSRRAFRLSHVSLSAAYPRNAYIPNQRDGALARQRRGTAQHVLSPQPCSRIHGAPYE